MNLSEHLTWGDAYIVWAALQAMVDDNHAPQDQLTAAQWDRAEAIVRDLTEHIDKTDGYE